MAKQRNVVWLWKCYDKHDKLLGDLEGSSESHAMEEASYMLPDTYRVERVRGSGQPKLQPEPVPRNEQFVVRYKLVGRRYKFTYDEPETLARRKAKVRAPSVEAAKALYESETNDPKWGVCRRIVTSVDHGW